MLNDDEKDQERASKPAQGLYQHSIGFGGKESKAGRSSPANGLGKFGKLLICSETSVNKVALSLLCEQIQRSAGHRSARAHDCSASLGQEVMGR